MEEYNMREFSKVRPQIWVFWMDLLAKLTVMQ